MSFHYYFKNKIKVTYTLLLLLMIANCGRKNNSFFNFGKKEPTVKINKLSLPSVRRLKATKQDEDTILLKWQPAQPTSTDRELVGYNIYKFARTSFIPKKPLNKSPIKETFLQEKIKTAKKNCVAVCYAIRPVFRIEGKIFEGPLSEIVSP